jgi:Zn-dependent protease
VSPCHPSGFRVLSFYLSLSSQIDFATVAIEFVVLIVSLSIHEAAHAWTADRLGDPTARRLGRLSLNPLVHLDPLGTVVLPLIAAVSRLPIIGWAKPVPVDPRNFREPRRDFAIVAAAGPISNLIQAVVAAAAFRAVSASLSQDVTDVPVVMKLLYYAVSINVLLALFNLVPVPPLDGGNVLAGLLPPNAASVFIQLRRYGFLILYALMLTGVLSAIIAPPASALLGILLP